MILSHIVAVDKNWAIGKNNTLPWHIPEDLKFFKETTSGKILIMGRKTFDSLGRLLPGRMHIVISRSPSESNNEKLKYVSSLDQAIKTAQSLIPNWPSEVFIIGGGEIYKQSADLIDCLYLTQIDKVVDGDTFYPIPQLESYQLESQNHFNTSEKFVISKYCRKVTR